MPISEITMADVELPLGIQIKAAVIVALVSHNASKIKDHRSARK
jgi:hypothetical protein